MTTKPLYESQQLRTVRLYGELGARFGRTHRLAVSSTAEAVRALSVLYKGFEKYLMEARDHGMAFAVFLGKRNIGEDALLMHTQQDIRIAPVLMGSKNSGLVSIILGVALIGVSFLIPGAGMFAAALFNAGIAMALGGVVQLLSPQPKDPKSKDKAENEPNYAFNGPVNTQAQGNCVPVAYGWPWTGSAVVSAGIQADDVYIPATTPGSLLNLLIASGPKFYYPMDDNPCVDVMGNCPNLTVGGDAVNGDLGIELGPSLSAGAYAAGAGALVGGTDCSFMVACRVSDPAGGAICKNIFGHWNNTFAGYNEWAAYLRYGTSNMRPVVAINNMAGGGYEVIGPDEMGIGDAFVIGFRLTGTLFELTIGGSVIASTTVTGSFGGAGALFAGGAYESLSYGMRGSIGQAIGWERALTNQEMSDYSSAILAGFSGTVVEGEGDAPLDPEDV